MKPTTLRQMNHSHPALRASAYPRRDGRRGRRHHRYHAHDNFLTVGGRYQTYFSFNNVKRADKGSTVSSTFPYV